MTGQVEILLAFFVYLIFFAWIGYRRGNRREWIVFATAVIAWIVLQEQGDIFVRLANLTGKFLAFVRAGGLGENQSGAFTAMNSAPSVITSTNRQGFLFLIWMFVLVLAYIISNLAVPNAKSKSDNWAILWGVANGFFYASVFLPRLLALVAPEGFGVTDFPAENNIFSLVGNAFGLLRNVLGGLWELIESQRSMILLLALTLFLVIAASSLKRNTKTQPK
jgi:hypothetical protein